MSNTLFPDTQLKIVDINKRNTDVSQRSYLVIEATICSYKSCSMFQVEPDYTEETVSLSSYPLSGALTCAKLCTAFEQAWDIV